MKPRYRRRKQTLRWKNFIGIVLIVAVLATLAGLAYFRYQLQSQQTVIDPVSLCPVDAQSPKYVALVFDKSDTFNPVQQQFLKRFFSQFKAQLVAGTQISIYVIEDNEKQQLEPKFVVCAPRTGADANVFYENPQHIQKRWQAQFEKPLDRVIKGFMQPGKADFSPIMEIFQSIALTAFPADASDVDKQIIIISDMLQHTPEWSHYRRQMAFNVLQKTSYYQRINTDLQNAQVDILYVRRDGMESVQSKRHAYFWAEYIQSIGGHVGVIEKIDG